MPKKLQSSVEPKFPYTTEPKALRRLLAEIPKRPKPPKLTLELLKAWGVSNNNNAGTAIRVLKTIGLLGSSAEPVNNYVQFMATGTGPVVLAERIKEIYKPLYESSLTPQNEPEEELKKLFNIHSGGGDDVMRLQIQTFKALSEYANFDVTNRTGDPKGVSGAAGSGADKTALPNNQHLPPIQVDLHIHLPENKSSRDYEAIIQDIAKYIYGREIDKS